MPNYEGLYQVSNLGRVKSDERVIIKKDGTVAHHKEKMRKLVLDHRGYMRVILLKDGIQKIFRAHRLVALTFIPNEDNKEQVNHVDGDKTNNILENLEWCTRQENMDHAVLKGLLAKRRKRDKNANSRCRKIIQINEYGAIVREYPSAAEAERVTGIHNSNILKVASKERKLAGGYMWDFAE